MAATGYTPIYLYYSSTTSNTPSAGNLGYGELALNITDKNLFFKDNTNAINTVPIRQSSGSSNGWLSSTDWTTFNEKQAALVSGTNIKTVSGTTLLGSGDLGTIGTAYGGTGLTGFTAANNAIYSTSSSVLTAGTLPIAAGGTAKTSLTANQILYGSFSQSSNFTYDGTNLTLTSGNYVVGTSGKGIDFSATPGTGTSELFADYEEGTWTATLTDGTNSVSLGTAIYTKIGRNVTLIIDAYNKSMSGLSTSANLTITGIPFTPVNASQNTWMPGVNVASTSFAIYCATNGIIYPVRTNNAVDINLVPLSVFGSPSNMSWQFVATYTV